MADMIIKLADVINDRPSSEADWPEAIERMQAGGAPAFALLAGTHLLGYCRS